ncbi:hypothetical protein CEXT_470621 [Caerostris extrusa]|uniref:Uncharacterized protein n=1 Tax=Caerostris extrusa TaxID=172846 RepID=A0AAV4P474_CAEEX|nr:hypothetical protein CEXT_470621 [Caerostris extrusa]
MYFQDNLPSQTHHPIEHLCLVQTSLLHGHSTGQLLSGQEWEIRRKDIPSLPFLNNRNGATWHTTTFLRDSLLMKNGKMVGVELLAAFWSE